MLRENDQSQGDMPKIYLENREEIELFSYLTPYIEKAGYFWKLTGAGLKDSDHAIISSYPILDK